VPHPCRALRPAGVDLRLGLAQAAHERLVRENVERLLKALEVLDAEDHGCRPAVLRDDDAAVLAFQPIDDLRQTVLHVCKRHVFGCRCHSHEYSQIG